jgi:hypothetical protein
VAAGVHFTKSINQISDVAIDFAISDNFPVILQYGSLDIVSDQPLSILALRLTTNQRGENLLTSTPIADLSAAVISGPLHFPQFTDAGGYV